MSAQKLDQPLVLTPYYRDYVWGGHRLRPDGQRAGEAWIVHENDVIVNGPFAGRTLVSLAVEFGPQLLGQKIFQRTPNRFPLFVKLLDCAEWLSVQVHPNDQQAVEMEGPDQFGKTEAWYFLDVDPGAEVLYGFQPGVTKETMAESIQNGTLLETIQRLKVQNGDSVFIPAGLVHALGPGMLLYEVQQTSDITYRVYDWGRPETPQRPLHIRQSIAVTDPTLAGQYTPPPAYVDGSQTVLSTCEYFTLSLLQGDKQSFPLDTAGESFHCVTVLEGESQLTGEGWSLPLKRFDTVVIPAACGAYQLVPQSRMKALLAKV